MAKVILYEEAIKDIDILTSALKVPYVLIQSADQSADQSDSWAKAIDAEDFSTTNTVAFLYESSTVVNGIPLNFDSLIKSITTKSEKLETIDLLTCNLTNNVSIDKIKALEARYNVQIRYSVDLTGHGDSMGDWVLESHDTDVKEIYFNEKIDEWKHILNSIDADRVLTVTDASTITTDLDGSDIRHTTIGTTIYQSNGSDIRHIIFSNPVETLINAFENFTNLEIVTFSDTVNLVGMWAFHGCTGLRTVAFNGAVGTLHEPGEGHGIMHQAFRNCTSLESVTFSGAVNHIHKKAFEGCISLTNVTFRDTVNSIGESAFEGCTGLTNVTFSGAVNSIVESAFKGCIGLTNVTFSDTVNSIGSSAFEGCTSLTSISIPRGVEIGVSAFKGCTGLKSITVYGDGTNIIHKDAFAEIYTSGSTGDAPTFLYIVDADADYFAAKGESAPVGYQTSFAERFSAAHNDNSTDPVANDVLTLPFGKARTTMYDLVAEAWGMIEKPAFTGKSEKGEFTLPHGFVDRPGLGNQFSKVGGTPVTITAFAGKIITLITSRDKSVGEFGVILENGNADQIDDQTDPDYWFNDKKATLQASTDAVATAVTAASALGTANGVGVLGVVMAASAATDRAFVDANAVREHALGKYIHHAGEEGTETRAQADLLPPDSTHPSVLWKLILDLATTCFNACKTADTNAKAVVAATTSSTSATDRSGLATAAAAAATAAKAAIDTFTDSTSENQPNLYTIVQSFISESESSDPSLSAALAGVAAAASAASDKATDINAAVNALANTYDLLNLFSNSQNSSWSGPWIQDVWRPFLSNVSLYTHLINHDLSYVDLSNAILTGANLSGATLTSAVTGPLHGGPDNNIPDYKVVSNSSTPPQTWIVGPDVDLSGANLSGANLSGANLSGADLSGAVLTDAVIGPLAPDSTTPSNLPTGFIFVDGTEKRLLQLGPGANLTNVVFSGANLSGADLSDADLTGAVLTDAVTGPLAANSTAPLNLPTGFVFADGTEKWLVGPGADLSDADLSGADLTGADLTGAVTGPLAANSTDPSNLPTGFVFVDGTEKWLVGPGADLSDADLSGADLSNVVITLSLASFDSNNPSYVLANTISQLNIIISDGVASIPTSAFVDWSNLKSIIIPDTVTSIGDSAFKWCSNLTSIVIPNSVTSIGKSAFYNNANLTSVVIGNKVTRIGDNAFMFCERLTSVVIGNKVTSIGNAAFMFCERLTSITIPNTVETIEAGAFRSCNLTSIVIPNSVTSIGSWAFYYNSNLTSVVVGNRLVGWGPSLFQSAAESLRIVSIDNPTVENVAQDSDLHTRIFLYTSTPPSATDLSGINFSGADLSGINLAGADLSNAVLTGAILGPLTAAPNADKLPDGYSIVIIGNNPWIITNRRTFQLKGAELTTDLSGLDGQAFAGLKSSGITGLTTAKLPGDYHLIDGYIIGPNVDLDGARFADVTFSTIKLNGVNLSNVTFDGTTTGPLVAAVAAPTQLPDNTYIINHDGSNGVDAGNYIAGIKTAPFSWLDVVDTQHVKIANQLGAGAAQIIENHDIVIGVKSNMLAGASTITTVTYANDAVYAIYVNCIISDADKITLSANKNVTFLNCPTSEDQLYDIVIGKTLTGSAPAVTNKYDSKIVLGSEGKIFDVGAILDHTVFIGCKFTEASKANLASSKVALLNCTFA